MLLATLKHITKPVFMIVKNAKAKQFTSVYHTTHRKLYAAVVNICRDKETALDILQKAYLKLWENWDKITDVTDAFPLLYTYSKNSYIDELRKLSTARKVADAITIASQDECGVSAEVQYKRKEYRSALTMALSRLTSRRREVMHLYLEEDLSRLKLAKKLDISPNTVDNHLQESLAFIRKELKLYLETGID